MGVELFRFFRGEGEPTCEDDVPLDDGFSGGGKWEDIAERFVRVYKNLIGLICIKRANREIEHI